MILVSYQVLHQDEFFGIVCFCSNEGEENLNQGKALEKDKARMNRRMSKVHAILKHQLALPVTDEMVVIFPDGDRCQVYDPADWELAALVDIGYVPAAPESAIHTMLQAAANFDADTKDVSVPWAVLRNPTPWLPAQSAMKPVFKKEVSGSWLDAFAALAEVAADPLFWKDPIHVGLRHSPYVSCCQPR